MRGRENGAGAIGTRDTSIGALLGVIMINLAGLVLVMNKIFGLTPVGIVITDRVPLSTTFVSADSGGR